MKVLHTILLTALAEMFLTTQAQAVLFWARPYDPNLGRWIQRDPIGERGGLNLYGYVQNNPIVKTDPLGLDNIYDMGSGNHAPPAMTISFDPCHHGSIAIEYHGGGLGDPLFLIGAMTGPPAWLAGGVADAAAGAGLPTAADLYIGIPIGTAIGYVAAQQIYGDAEDSEAEDIGTNSNPKEGPFTPRLPVPAPRSVR